jgi:capsular exopolysaccharide synthesis family protein
MAAAGDSTVLVDCDLRRSNLHTRLDLPREPGFTDYFVREVELSSLVRTTGQENLSVLPAGPLPPNPPAILARPELETALDELRQHYRWILVDSPPVAAVTDALLLSQHADSTVLVVQQNKVDRLVLKRAIAALRKVTPNLLGAVLNAVDVKSKAYYGYSYKDRRGSPEADRPPSEDAPSGEGAAAGEVRDASVS